MDFTRTLTHPAKADVVARMCLDEEFMRLRAQEAGFTEVDVKRVGNSIQTTITLPRELLPSMALMRLPQGITPVLVVTDSWTINEDGNHVGHLAVNVPYMPVEAEAHCLLTQTDTGETRREVTGSLHVRVPLFGRRIEEQMCDRLDDLLAAEERVVLHWLATRSPHNEIE